MRSRSLWIVFCMILLVVPIVLALEFDNTAANFDANENSIEIMNMFGMGDKIADVTLIENTDQALIKGRAVFEVTLYQSYSGDVVDEVTFYDTVGQEKTGTYNWRYWGDVEYTVNTPIYQEIAVFGDGNASSTLVGYDTEIRTRKEWIDYDGQNFQAGTYLFELKGQKDTIKSIDFIPTFFGVELPEFAWWNGNWHNKIQINVTENSGADQTDYTIRLNITYDTGMKTDFSDLRFLNTAETTELGFFTAAVYDSDHAIVFVKVDNLTTAAVTPIYMYFNNTAASSASDPDEGFLRGELNRSLPANGLVVDPLWGIYGVNYSIISMINWSNSSGIHQSIVGFNDSSSGEPAVGFSYHNNPAFPYSPSSNLQLITHNATSGADVFNHTNISFYVGNSNTFGWNIYEVHRLDQNTTFDVNYQNFYNLSSNDSSAVELSPVFKATGGCAGADCASFLTNWTGVRKSVYPPPTSINGSSIPFSGNASIVKNSPTEAEVLSGTDINFTCSAVVTGGTGLNVSNISILAYDPDDTQVVNVLREYTGVNTSVVANHFFNVSGDWHGNETWNFNCWLCLDDDACSYNNDEVTGSSANVTFNVDNIFPDITVDTPVIWFNTSNVPINFSIGAELNLQTCFYSLDGAANATFGTANTTVNASVGSHDALLYCNDTFGNINRSNQRVNISAYYIADIVQNATSVESSDENFQMIVTRDGNITLEVELNYNNTIHLPSSSVSETNRTFLRTITLPLIESLEVTKNAIWNITGNYNGSTALFQVPAQPQVLNQFYISNCSDVTANASQIAFNITFRDEATNVITGSNFSSSFTARLASGSASKTFGFPQNDTTTFQQYVYCIFPNFTSIVADTQIVYGGGIYDTRFYAANDKAYDNDTEFLDLFLIDIDDSTAITITITDDNDLALEGFAVEAQLYNVINNSFTLMESKITDPEGITVMQLDVSGGKQYQFIIRDPNGNIVLTVPKFEITATTYTFQVIPPSATGLDQYINIQQLLEYSLTHSTVTENVTLTWDDTPNDLITNGCLRINRRAFVNDNNTIVDTCSEDAVGNIEYNLGNESAEFVAIFHATSSQDGKDYVITSINIDQRTGADIFGLEGLWWVFILMLTVALMTAKVPEVGIGMNVLILFALYALGMVGITGTTIIGLVVVAAFIVVKMVISKSGS